MAIDRFHIINSRYGYSALNEIYLLTDDDFGPRILFNPYGFENSEGDIQNNWSIYLNLLDNGFYVMGHEENRESFMAKLSEDYPDDLVWILFHPEVLSGRFNG